MVRGYLGLPLGEWPVPLSKVRGDLTFLHLSQNQGENLPAELGRGWTVLPWRVPWELWSGDTLLVALWGVGQVPDPTMCACTCLPGTACESLLHCVKNSCGIPVISTLSPHTHSLSQVVETGMEVIPCLQLAALGKCRVCFLRGKTSFLNVSQQTMQGERKREKCLVWVRKRVLPEAVRLQGGWGEAAKRGCYKQTYVPPSHKHEVLEPTGPGTQWDLH